MMEWLETNMYGENMEEEVIVDSTNVSGEEVYVWDEHVNNVVFL